jgi:hypothetical protein
MAHIVKIIQEGNQWRIEDWKQRWVQVSNAASIKCGSQDATTYGNVFPYSYEWHWLKMIAKGKGNVIYHHAHWLGTEWSLAGSCHDPKRKW